MRGIALAETKKYEGAPGGVRARPGFRRPQAGGLLQAARALELGGKRAEAKKAYQQYAVVFPGGPWAKAADAAAGKL